MLVNKLEIFLKGSLEIIRCEKEAGFDKANQSGWLPGMDGPKEPSRE